MSMQEQKAKDRQVWRCGTCGEMSPVWCQCAKNAVERAAERGEVIFKTDNLAVIQDKIIERQKRKGNNPPSKRYAHLLPPTP